VADRVVTDPEERQFELKSGVNRIENEVAWARYRLVQLGLIKNEQRGIWELTEEGMQTKLSLQQARELHGSLTKAEQLAFEVEAEPVEDPKDVDLIEAVKGLSPSGFERLCQHILRKAGFVDVDVTGR
jgi:restriction system protein